MGFGLHRRQHARIWSRIRSLVLYALASLTLLYAIVTFTPLTIWWTSWLQGPADSQPGEVMVVLAGSMLSDDFLGVGSYWRSAFAVEESGKGRYQRILLSGGGAFHPSAAEQMKSFLVASGLDARIIETEIKSTSTHTNAEFSAVLLRGETRPIALVTSDFHMGRAARLFEKQGIAVLRRPYPDTGLRAERRAARFEIAYELAVETAKVIYYKLRGWT